MWVFLIWIYSIDNYLNTYSIWFLFLNIFKTFNQHLRSNLQFPIKTFNNISFNILIFLILIFINLTFMLLFFFHIFTFFSHILQLLSLFIKMFWLKHSRMNLIKRSHSRYTHSPSHLHSTSLSPHHHWIHHGIRILHRHNHTSTCKGMHSQSGRVQWRSTCDMC